MLGDILFDFFKNSFSANPTIYWQSILVQTSPYACSAELGSVRHVTCNESYMHNVAQSMHNPSSKRFLIWNMPFANIALKELKLVKSDARIILMEMCTQKKRTAQLFVFFKISSTVFTFELQLVQFRRQR